MVKSVHKYLDEVYGGLYDTPNDAIAAEHAQVIRTKKLVIDCCDHCPMVMYRGICVAEELPYCTHAATDGAQIIDMDMIPDWCKLEDD